MKRASVFVPRISSATRVKSALVATALCFLSPAVAAVVAGEQSSSASVGAASTNELAGLLDLRAGEVLKHMQVSKTAGLKLIRDGHGYATREQFVAGWQERREVFQNLHKENIDALKRHDFALSHEITTEIDVLLWDNEKFLFSATQANRAMHFEVFFDQPDQLAKTTYPGAIPQSFSKTSAQQAALITQPPTGRATGPDMYEEPARKLKALLNQAEIPH